MIWNNSEIFINILVTSYDRLLSEMFETFCDENKNPEDTDRRMKFRTNPQRFNSPVVGRCIKSHNRRLKIKAKEPYVLSN